MANPPFTITTALIRRLLTPNGQLVSAHLVVPLHAAERWASYRYYGASRWGPSFAGTVDRVVPRSAFRPPCPGPVAVLRIERRVASVGSSKRAIGSGRATRFPQGSRAARR